jgi:hypothetical protein
MILSVKNTEKMQIAIEKKRWGNADYVGKKGDGRVQRFLQ